jgi:hypothetical protein
VQKGVCPKAIFTHCGSQIVTSDARRIDARIAHFGRQFGVNARVARDGTEIVLRGSDGSI